MASAQPLRIGIVGCGGISERHAHGAAATDAVSIVACCDVRPDIAQEWSRRHGCERAYADYLTMVREHELDAVLIATWPNLHRDQVLGCLEAGARSILCEKSLALTGVEAIEIWTAAGEAGALVVEGFMYRHHPAIAGIDELLAAGSVGQLDNIWAAFSLFDPAESEATGRRSEPRLAAAEGVRGRRPLGSRLLLRRRVQPLRGFTSAASHVGRSNE
jgi:predicted dehydrogenase